MFVIIQKVADSMSLLNRLIVLQCMMQIDKELLHNLRRWHVCVKSQGTLAVLRRALSD